MGLKSILAIPFASFIANRLKREANNAIADQEKIRKYLLRKHLKTQYGKHLNLNSSLSYQEFKEKVPVTDYEGIRSWIEKSLNGEENVLWPGRPLYWSKTSGTTSGVKFIPVSKESISFQINAARNALLNYIHQTGKADFVNGKLIFLSGSPELDDKNGIPVGRLSGIVNHHVPSYLRRNQLPSYETNCIEDWEQKVEAIAKETMNQNMTLISGIPPWVQMYFDKLIELTGKKPGDLFPHFSLFVYGGVNFEPYRSKIEATIGRKVDTLETYPASEGFIAFQNELNDPALLLLTNAGIFYEFIPVDKYFDSNPPRFSLSEVEMNVNYAIILNTNAGLLGYSIGDTVKFVSLKPYKILVTGRIKHFISAFGEHVIGEEVEWAILQAAEKFNVQILEFTVAPNVTPKDSLLPYHEWFIEFDQTPVSLLDFADEIDRNLQLKNLYYQDLRIGGVLNTLIIRPMKKGSFQAYMKSIGKLGGQNKLPRLSNERQIADEILKFD